MERSKFDIFSFWLTKMPKMTLSKDLLNDLTRIKMPRGFIKPEPDQNLEIRNQSLPIYKCDVLVVGSGAAGLRAAVELKRRGKNVLIATSGVGMGTSACSGSDKQTLHTSSTRARGDDFYELAKSIASGGAMDMDIAYVEALGSVQAAEGLQFLGLPLPKDRFGGVLRYQTDHDEYGRATSCGPRTSRLMVKVLAEEVKRLEIPVLSRCTAVEITKTKLENSEEIASGLFFTSNSSENNPYGLGYIQCENLVLATGGPGELYRDSVYPGKCHGSLGLALEAGITLSNLTESQFGISTGRDAFPWNLSGSYMQAIPHIYSIAEDGKEVSFLESFFPDTASLCNAVFQKGYQWPFHADRTLGYQSSLVDLAIYEQQKMGREVFMDFLRNPACNTKKDFDVAMCSDEVRSYLANNEANGALPIERLERLNPLAIELYKQNGTDLKVQPLKFGVNNQHLNGGIEVDLWGRTSLDNCYAVGELASTHGVTRPGGAALNSGQVFGLRVAEHVCGKAEVAPAENTENTENIVNTYVLLSQSIESALEQKQTSIGIEALRNEVQRLMSDHAGFVTSEPSVKAGLKDLKALALRPIHIETPSQAGSFFLWRQNTLAAIAIAVSLDDYIKRGGVSRGARLVCTPSGDKVPRTANGLLESYRHLGGDDPLANHKQLISMFAGSPVPFWRSTNPEPVTSDIYFEKNWPDFLTNTIYNDEAPA